MKVEEIFGLLLRVIGVVALFYGVWFLIDAFLFHLGYFQVPGLTVGMYLIEGLFIGAVGLYLLRGAPLLIEFAFPEQDEEEDSEENPEEDTDPPM